MSNPGKKNLPEPSFQSNLQTYFKGVRSEWGKITWPAKPQVIQETFAVLIVVTAFVILVSFYDWIFSFVAVWFAK